MTNEISILAALINFCLISYFVICFYRGFNGSAKNTITLSDRFDIGYVDHKPVTIVVKEEKIPKLLRTPKPISQPAPKNSAKIELFNKCVNSLIEIGFDKKHATKLVKDFLSKNKISTWEEFCVKFNEH